MSQDIRALFDPIFGESLRPREKVMQDKTAREIANEALTILCDAVNDDVPLIYKSSADLGLRVERTVRLQLPSNCFIEVRFNQLKSLD